jgi:hypothetical protein
MAKTMKLDMNRNELTGVFYFISGEEPQDKKDDDTIKWFDAEFRRALSVLPDNYASKGSKKSRYDSKKSTKSDKKSVGGRRSSVGGVSRRSNKSRPVSGKSRTITIPTNATNH